ncbi:hypothetical protein DS745_07295 [Anaerobacillus alkaliphilus]|uniref:Uncharacterized protein n=1 Tax=Anaerobacillus alkaliphilus TaxID=1548597 RepID=A0A4Q0VVU1_9BACI|nr:InlB B-repeat-containing protein [Anaerobacillus alkaliphilus]RXJ02192.1 hypothetical protein DS745_07295 [Anaerobacillus alkaliphilus]
MTRYVTNKKMISLVLIFLLMLLFVNNQENQAQQQENVVRSKTVTASGETLPFRATNAVDGSSTNASRWYTSTANAWLQVDLGDFYTIDRYVVVGMGHIGFPSDRNPRAFRLQSSKDGNTWTNVDVVTNNTAGRVDKFIPKFNARYLRLTIDQGNQNNNLWASIVEFEAYGILYNPAKDATLQNLSLSHGLLDPIFQSDTTDYEVNVGNDIETISVTPTLTVANASVSVNGQTVVNGNSSQAIRLDVGENEITIEVTSQDGTITKLYKITVTRAGSSNADLSNLTISDGNLTPDFDPTITEYAVNVAKDISSVDVTATVADPTATIEIKGSAVTSGTATSVPLSHGSSTIEIVVTAQNQSTKTYTIIVTRGKPPVITPSPGNTILAFGKNSTIIDSGVELSDADSDHLIAASITLSNAPDGVSESLGITATGASLLASKGMAAVYNASTRELTITGAASLETYQELLRSVTYVNSSTFPNKSERTIFFVVKDEENNLSEARTKTIEWGVNTPPVIATNETLVVDKFKSSKLTRDYLESNDDASNPNQIIYTLNSIPSQGTLKRGETVIQVGGTFTQEDINHEIIFYEHNGNEFADQFEFKVSDGELFTADHIFTISIENINHPPTILSPPTLVVTEDVSTPLTGITFADRDAGGASVEVSFSVARGKLSANTGSGVTVTGSNSTQLTLLGTIADINAYIASSQLMYVTAENDVADVTLTISINDLGNTGSGGAQQAHTTVKIQVTAVNDAPTIQSPSTLIITEDIINPLTEFSFADIDAGANAVEVTFGVARGKFFGNTGSGVTVSGSNSTQIKLLGSIADLNSYIASSQLMYVTAENDVSDVILTININDLGNTGSGGAQQATVSVTMQIITLNTAPVLTPFGPTLHSIRVDDIDNAGQTIASIIGESITDEDPGALKGIAITSASGNGTWEYSIDGGTTWEKVGLVSGAHSMLLRDTDFIRFVPSGANETLPRFSYRAWDQTSGTAGGIADTTVNGLTTAFSATSDTATITIIHFYHVTFEVDGGSAIPSQKIYHGETATEPSIPPVKENYIFSGWYTNSLLDEVFDFSTPITMDTVVYAKWEPVTYKVIFKDHDGSELKTETVAHNQGATAPADPTREGYTFTGWDKDFTQVTGDLTVTAQYGINEYTVFFDSKGGSDVEPIQANYGTKITAPKEPTRVGYTFVGWYKEDEFTNEWDFSTDTVPTGNVTLYAKWNVVWTPSQPTREVISGSIETGNISAGTMVKQIPINRITGPDRKVKDEVILTTEQMKEVVKKILQLGKNIARIIIPDDKDEVSQVDITIPKAATKQLGDANIDLEVFTENIRFTITQQFMDRFAKEELFFRLLPIKGEKERKEVENRLKVEQAVKQVAKNSDVNVVSRPISVETNMQSGAVTLVLPLRDVQLPVDVVERAKFLTELVVFIEHSDGEKRLVKGRIVEYKDGHPGLEFSVNEYGTFTILHSEGFAGKFREAYIKGYEDGTFKPDQKVTRAEVAVMIARNLGYDHLQKVEAQPFSDVQVTHWAASAIDFVKKYGLMKGDSKGEFKPNKVITRAEMATIVARYKKLALLDEVKAQLAFPDIKGHWAVKEIAANKQAGIIHGYQDGTFRPNGSLSRAEAVKVLNRMFDRNPLADVDKPTFIDVPRTHWAYGDIEAAVEVPVTTR